MPYAPSARDCCWFAAIKQQTQITSLTADGSPVTEESESWDPKATQRPAYNTFWIAALTR